MRDPARRLASIALLAAACASSRPAPSAPPPRPMKLLPRSSVAAVLAHRGELELDDRQVQKLEAIDDELQRNYGAGTPSTPAVSPGGSTPQEALQPAGGRPRDEGSSAEAMGRHREGHRGNGGRGESGAKPPKPSARGRSWDDADTAAYYRAEEILRPDQRERAREIAEKYREELYEQRVAAKPGAPR